MLPFALLLLVSECLEHAKASPLIRRQQQDEPESEQQESTSSGHLANDWVIVIAVVFSVVVVGVIGTVLWVKLRRQRRARETVHVRSSSPYDCIRQSRHAPVTARSSTKTDELVSAPLPVVTYERHRNSSSPSEISR